MGLFWLILYNTILVPICLLMIYIFSLFNEKMRTGLSGRHRTWIELQKFRKKNPARELYLIHSASLGEFEQAKPVIRGLKSFCPDILIVASFSSPSGYRSAARIPEVDLFIYLPLDTFFRTRSFIQKLKPQKIIFVTYDLWLNLIFNAKRHHVPTYLMSARIRKDSLKCKPVVRSFFRSLYRTLDYIFTVSDEDGSSLEKLFGSVRIKVLTLGDTRYDQVVHRARENINSKIPKLFDDGFIFIGGSIWPQDARHLLPALFRIMKLHSTVNVILAPHEPNSYALEMLEYEFRQNGFYSVRLSRFEKLAPNIRAVLIDRVGILAEIYHMADLAFVGGGFRGSIHNVMEPAVAGLPVLFGPTYHNSREAELLLKDGGAWCCRDSDCFFERIKLLIEDSVLYKKASNSAKMVVMKNLGASGRTVKEILESG